MIWALLSGASASMHGSVARLGRRIFAYALLLIAAGFFVAAAFIYVLRFYDPEITAAAFGAVFLIIAIVIMIANAIAARRVRRRTPSLATAAMANPVAAAGILNLVSRGRILPLLTLGAAAAIGVALSGALPRKSTDG